jgi:hypothetical protein
MAPGGKLTHQRPSHYGANEPLKPNLRVALPCHDSAYTEADLIQQGSEAMASEAQEIKTQLRMPKALKNFVDAEAKRTFSSMNSVIVRAIAERKERREKARKHDNA